MHVKRAARAAAGSIAAILLTWVTAEAAPESAPVQSRPAAGAVASVPGRITGVTIVPAVPRAGDSIRVRVDGTGTCAIWYGASRLDAPPNTPTNLPTGWPSLPKVNLMPPKPNAKLALPGELPPLTLGAGRWSVGAHAEGTGGNCKGSAYVEIQVGSTQHQAGKSRLPAAGAPNASAPGPGAPAPQGPSAQGSAAGAAGASSSLIGRITGMTIAPAAPRAGDGIRVRVDGSGTCYIWYGISRLDAPANTPGPLPPGWHTLSKLNFMPPKPDAKLALPGDLPLLTLGAGRWSVGAQAEAAGGNCTGSAYREFQVAVRP